ncbi:MAG: DUF1566 domain-containing protein [Dysgonamonadaceae bacterium]|jgi:hypothetical protein|nr:DUF1566 domain-containing protein [Dysgonamonadaceae bacterium]
MKIVNNNKGKTVDTKQSSIINLKRFFLLFLLLPAAYLASGQTPGTPYGVRIIDCSAAPVQPGTITIDPAIVGRNSAFTASIDTVPGATSYIWTIPSGLTPTGTQNTTEPRITITGVKNGTYTAGSIKVKAKNTCGLSVDRESTVAVTVKELSCPGYICTNCAFDYSSDYGSVPGDASKGRAPTTTNTDENDTWSPNVKIGDKEYIGDDAIFFKAFTSANKDLCVYKVDGNSGNITNWATAVSACNGQIDGKSDWYLPNLRELRALYNSLGGRGSSATGTAATFGDGGAAMLSSYYWSSTEHSDNRANYFYFGDGHRYNHIKKTNLSMRCVRRM